MTITEERVFYSLLSNCIVWPNQFNQIDGGFFN